MADTLTQTVTTESFSTQSGSSLLLTLLATSILSQGTIGPAGPEGGGEVAVPEFPIIDPQFASSLARASPPIWIA